jgi:hypothetical protein
MSFASWLRNLKTRFPLPRTHRSGPLRHTRRTRTVPVLEALEDRALPSAYVVTTTADGGPGSLRDAISAINADTDHALYASPSSPSVDEIDFAITAASDTGRGYNPVTGVASIALCSALPPIRNAVLINGYTQAGASENTLANGDNAVLKIDLDGSGFDSPSNGASNPSAYPTLVLGNGVTVRGLVINRGIGVGVFCAGTGDTLSGNFIPPRSWHPPFCSHGQESLLPRCRSCSRSSASGVYHSPLNLQ